ncbi:ATPase, partial [Staphylococcus epidermidis]|nr:ATPase [Staphylococcus epidermidis]
AKFNKQQSEDLENLKQKTEKILSDGKEIKPLIERLESENNDLQIKVNEANERVQRIENRINKLKAGNVDITQTDEYKSILNDINVINQKRTDIKTTISDKVAKIDEQINELTQEKVAFENAKAIESSNEHLDKVIKDLRSEENQLLDKKEDYEHQLYILKEFTTTKVKMLTENINKKFKMANFKLFNHQVN